MLTSFLIGLVASAIVAIVYGLVFAQREGRIRATLAAKRKGWARRRYIRAFIGALRGEASTTDTRLLAQIILYILLSFSLLILAGSEAVDIGMKKIDATLASIEQDVAKLEGRTINEPHPTVERLRKLQSEVASLRSWGYPLVRALWVLGLLGIALFYAALWFWLPFVVMRRHFAFELERFTLRIQGLASKAELAELALAESLVKDEETLRAFVAAAAVVAECHSVPQLVETFNLWEKAP